MSQVFTIDDNRTIYCKTRMRGNGGVWNPVTAIWMFGNAEEHANALCELYRATRASIAMRETLGEMIADGTAMVAWNFDPLTQTLDIEALDYAEAQPLLAAGYAARRVLGVHPLESPEADHFTNDEDLRTVAFDEHARAGHTKARRGRSVT